MATARKMHLTKTTGEYLVCVELCRRGWLATTFTGSLPQIDILATNKHFQTLFVQVKAKVRGDWSLRAYSFLNIDYNEKTKIQTIIGKRDLKDLKIVYVFVKVVAPGKDEFFIISMQDLQEIVFEDYTQFIGKHRGIRPKTPE